MHRKSEAEGGPSAGERRRARLASHFLQQLLGQEELLPALVAAQVDHAHADDSEALEQKCSREPASAYLVRKIVRVLANTDRGQPLGKFGVGHPSLFERGLQQTLRARLILDVHGVLLVDHGDGSESGHGTAKQLRGSSMYGELDQLVQGCPPADIRIAASGASAFPW
jgi:hypothetical protein